MKRIFVLTILAVLTLGMLQGCMSIEEINELTGTCRTGAVGCN